MPAQVDVQCSLNKGQQHATEKAAASFPDAWRFTVISEQADGFRLRVDGPGLTTSRVFALESAPDDITAFLRMVREQLAR